MSVSTTKGERRRKSRKRPLTLVYVELASQNGGMMRDLSEEGFAVRAMMPVRAGENTPFSFSLSETIRIEGRGEIHWIQENGHVAGVRFLDLPANAREQIRQWLIRPEMPPKREPGARSKEISLEELRDEIHTVPSRAERKPGVKAPVPAPAQPAALEEPLEPEKVASVPPVEVHSSGPAHAAPPVEAEVHTKAAAPQPEIVKEKEPVAVSEPLPAAPVVVPKEAEHVAPAVAKKAEPAPPVVTKEPEREAPVVAKVPEPPVPPVVAKEITPVVVPVAPIVVERPHAGSSVVEVAPVAAVSLAAVHVAPTPVTSAPTVYPPEKPTGPIAAPEAEPKRASIFEEPEAPALPKLTLFPKVVDSDYPSEASRLTASQEVALPKQHWKPIPPVEAPPESEFKAREAQQTLPDISAVLMQPSGRALRPAPQIPAVETLASWDQESVAGESWSQRFSLTRAILLMSIVALLASLYVFHRNVGQGLIWLGEQMGGVPGSSATATQLQQPAAQEPDASTQPSEQSVQAANSATPERQADADSAAKNVAPPVSPFSGVAATGSSPDEGQSEYLQAMELRRTKGAAAMQETLRLLWIAVEKGNANAELELAGMYWQGQGVIRNCDQAHILLTAAARKGSAEAQKTLLEFQRVGCE